MPQLRSPRAPTMIPHATTKTRCSQKKNTKETSGMEETIETYEQIK